MGKGNFHNFKLKRWQLCKSFSIWIIYHCSDAFAVCTAISSYIVNVSFTLLSVQQPTSSSLVSHYKTEDKQKSEKGNFVFKKTSKFSEYSSSYPHIRTNIEKSSIFAIQPFHTHDEPSSADVIATIESFISARHDTADYLKKSVNEISIWNEPAAGQTHTQIFKANIKVNYRSQNNTSTTL